MRKSVRANNITDFKNRYCGERIFLIGNGPSLSQTPLERLDDEYTMAMNKIHHIYSETGWRPSFYLNAVSESTFLRDYHENKTGLMQNISLDIPCFVHADLSGLCPSNHNIYYFNRVALFNLDVFHSKSLDELQKMPVNYLYEFWSDDVSNFIYTYHSMYAAIQLAVYMGFDEIYFVGCDLGMEYNKPHMVFSSGLDPHRFRNGKVAYVRKAIKEGNLPQSILNGVAMKLIENFGESQVLKKFFQQSNQDHFTSDYTDNLIISDGKKSEHEIQKSHTLARKICEDKNIDIYNATIGGELDIYERVNIENVI